MTQTSATSQGSKQRWTGAAVARFASKLVRRGLNEFAPPGQLGR
jgi:hypothetical protein